MAAHQRRGRTAGRLEGEHALVDDGAVQLADVHIEGVPDDLSRLVGDDARRRPFEGDSFATTVEVRTKLAPALFTRVTAAPGVKM